MKYQDFFLLKNHILLCAVKALFLSFTCEDIGIAMVTNINFDFWNWKYKYYCLYFSFISEFHNIFVTGILR